MDVEETAEASEVVEETTEDVIPKSDPLLNVLTDTEDESEDNTEDKVDETVKDEATDEETTPEDENKTDELTDDQPLDPKEEARKRYEERQKARLERSSRIKEVTEAYIDESDSETERRVRAIESQEYARTVENTENTLISDFDRAISSPDLKIFDQASAEYNEALTNKAISDFNAGYIEFDTNGNPVGLKKSLYEHLKETAEIYKSAIRSGQIKQVRDTRNMKSNATPKPAAQPKETQKDMLLDILKSE